MENNHVKKQEVSFYDKTYYDAKEFRTRLEILSKKVNLTTIRYYLLSNHKDPIIADEIYNEADELKKLRATAIQREMQHALAQAQLAGITLTKDVIEGIDLSIGFKQEIIDKVPSLNVYSLFMFYSKTELEKLLNNDKQS